MFLYFEVASNRGKAIWFRRWEGGFVFLGGSWIELSEPMC
jgi:hypothetical protein